MAAFVCKCGSPRVLRQGKKDNTLAKTDKAEGIQAGRNYGEHSVWRPGVANVSGRSASKRKRRQNAGWDSQIVHFTGRFWYERMINVRLSHRAARKKHEGPEREGGTHPHEPDINKLSSEVEILEDEARHHTERKKKKK